MTDEPPTPTERPYSFIQWKGTNVCMDWTCECGAEHHICGDFVYHIKCPDCNTVYESPWYITGFRKLTDQEASIRTCIYEPTDD